MKHLLTLYAELFPQLMVKLIENYAIYRGQCCK